MLNARVGVWLDEPDTGRDLGTINPLDLSKSTQEPYISSPGCRSTTAQAGSDSPNGFTWDQLPSPWSTNDAWGLPPAKVEFTEEVSDFPSLKFSWPRWPKIVDDAITHKHDSDWEDPSKYTTFDTNNNYARTHELYNNVIPHIDGLYHCPWEGKDICQHRPEKLKCNYE